jgi:Methyltransferase domain
MSAGVWERVHAGRDPTTVSWYQAVPAVSLELLDALGILQTAALIDVGAGASTLVDHLLARGFDDVTVLDVSRSALAEARRRVGDDPRVTWLQEDLLAWSPQRRFGLWHDRAVYHFLVDDEARERYRTTLAASLVPGAAVIVATFAADGPEVCSGLPTRRYSPEELASAFGPGFRLVTTRREEHRTPGGVVQPFTWVALRAI